MLVFWSLAALLVLVTLSLLLWPLLRARRAAPAPDVDAAALSVYRDQKRALDEELVEGAITSEEHDATVTELARRLGEEVAVERRVAFERRDERRAWTFAIALALLIPTAAALLYARLGNPAAGTASVVADAGVRDGHELSDAQIAGMVDKLAQRLKSRPDDADGWVLLARSYASLGRFPEAADAYAHSVALVPDDAGLLADYADVLAMAHGRKLDGEPAALAQRALALDPKHKKALALAATAAMEADDLGAALGYWRRLLAEFPEGSDDAKRVAQIIAEVDSASREGRSFSGSQTGRANAPVAATSPKSAPGTSIGGQVDVSPALASKVALNDTVFIFARALEGPRMPLAILRIPAKELPKDFTLDDSMGMGSGAKLSSAPAVVIEARISKTGNAVPQAGDLSGKSAPVKPGATGVKVTIDQVVP